MKAKKLKIYVKTSKFAIPIPALRFSTIRWISKLVFKYCPPKVRSKKSKSELGEYDTMEYIMKNLTLEDVNLLIDQLEKEEPFCLVDVDTYNKKEGRTIVKIYTL
jgi:hypothetical protein